MTLDLFSLALFVIAGLFVGSLLFVVAYIGYRVGQDLARREHPAAPPIDVAPTSWLAHELAAGLREGSFHPAPEILAQMAAQSPAVREELRHTLARFTDAIQQVAKKLEASSAEAKPLSPPTAGDTRSYSPDQRHDSQPPKASDLRRDAESSSAPGEQRPALSARAIQEFTRVKEGAVDTSGDASSRRYPYDCFQMVLPWHDGEPMPDPATAVAVRCHDISVHGVSFYWHEAPDFKNVLISLGRGEGLMFMKVEVRHTKTVYMHGEFKYVIGCRFEQVMNEFTERWRKRPDRSDQVSAALTCA